VLSKYVLVFGWFVVELEPVIGANKDSALWLRTVAEMLLDLELHGCE